MIKNICASREITVFFYIISNRNHSTNCILLQKNAIQWIHSFQTLIVRISIVNQVIRVCALEKDFQQLTYGDRTIVGERGISLSGGQRARINLARYNFLLNFTDDQKLKKKKKLIIPELYTNKRTFIYWTTLCRLSTRKWADIYTKNASKVAQGYKIPEFVNFVNVSLTICYRLSQRENVCSRHTSNTILDRSRPNRSHG